MSGASTLEDLLKEVVKTPDLLKEYLDDQQAYGLIREHSHFRWLVDFLRVSAEIQEGSLGQDKHGLFWIRLYGVLTETVPWLEARVKVFEKLKLGSKLPDKFSYYFGQVQMVLNILNKIQSALPYDDLVFIDYARQTQCHVNQDGYRYRIDKNKKKIMDQYKPKTTGKKESIITIERIIAERLRFFDKKSSIWEPAAIKYYLDKIHSVSEGLPELAEDLNKSLYLAIKMSPA